MKKWAEFDVKTGKGMMSMQGPEIVDFFSQIMQNQNEMIDFLEQTHPTAFRIHQERSGDETRDNSR